MGLLIRLILNALALYAVPYIVSGVRVTGFIEAIVAALILGIVNAVIKPILVLLSLPLEILTLGLFTLVINAALFYVVAQFGVGLRVDNFGSAFLGALVLSVISFLLAQLIRPARRA